MGSKVEELVERLIRLKPDEAFLVVAQLMMYPEKVDLAWAIAKRLCDEYDAARLLARIR